MQQVCLCGDDIAKSDKLFYDNKFNSGPRCTQCQTGYVNVGNNCIDICIHEGIDCGIGGTCLAGNCTISAEFKFDMQFIDDYDDLEEEKSKQLWFQVEKSLKRSFGGIEIDFTLKKIVKGSVKILVEIIPLTDGSAEDVKMLLENNDETCKRILGNDVSTFGTGCWTQNTKAVFAQNDFVFLGVEID